MQSLCPESGLRIGPNWSKIEKMTMKSQFYDMTLTSTFFDVFLFRFSSLVTGLSFISRLTRNPEIRNTLALFGDWDELWIKNLARMSLTECYWTLQNFRITAFTLFELLRENQLRSKITPSPNHPVVHHLVRYLVYTMFKSNNRPSFHSWFKGI